jgi:c-di-GMP-binding flagellar brake protein YcgR
MQIGTILEIQIEGIKSRLKSELFAIEEGNYLIIKLSPFQSLANFTKLVYEGTVIIIRYIHRGTMFGFKSRIKHVMIEPAKLIFIEYPEKIESQDLRVHKRLDCYLPANVRIEDNTIAGTITDISREGCQFTVKTLNIGKSADLLQIDNEIGVSFQLPGVEEKLTITGKQKNIKKDKDNVNIGVLFSDMSIEVQETLYGFLSTAEA